MGTMSGFSCMLPSTVPVELMSGFPRMSMVGRLQKQLSVTSNFPNEKSPFDVAFHQNCLTACYYYYV